MRLIVILKMCKILQISGSQTQNYKKIQLCPRNKPFFKPKSAWQRLFHTLLKAIYVSCKCRCVNKLHGSCREALPAFPVDCKSYPDPVSIRCLPPLQSDIGPFPHNQTDTSDSRVPGGGGLSGGPESLADPGHGAGAGGPWRMEDIEGELERKVELLEKERKALRMETQRHRQEINQGINKLHHRISGLEKGGKERKKKRKKKELMHHPVNRERSFI